MNKTEFNKNRKEVPQCPCGKSKKDGKFSPTKENPKAGYWDTHPYQEGILVVIDGGKGIRKAVDVVFGEKAFVQRCRWHKRENVLSYLNENDKETYKRKIQHAYQEDDYAQAKAALDKIGNELKVKNIKAYYSLQEGLEETTHITKAKSKFYSLWFKWFTSKSE